MLLIKQPSYHIHWAHHHRVLKIMCPHWPRRICSYEFSVGWLGRIKFQKLFHFLCCFILSFELNYCLTFIKSLLLLLKRHLHSNSTKILRLHLQIVSSFRLPKGDLKKVLVFLSNDFSTVISVKRKKAQVLAWNPGITLVFLIFPGFMKPE